MMRQHHVAGEKAFVDYSGKRVGIVDPSTGEIREAEIFVGVLGASNLTYAEATWTQTLPDWTGDLRCTTPAPRLITSPSCFGPRGVLVKASMDSSNTPTVRQVSRIAIPLTSVKSGTPAVSGSTSPIAFARLARSSATSALPQPLHGIPTCADFATDPCTSN